MKSNGIGFIHSSINAIMVLGLNMSIIKSTNYGKHMTFEKKKMIPHFMWNFSLKIALLRCIVTKGMKELRNI